jgi:catechol 2,3-dioxygenase-like lactoylglutathione lyase family enzyme
MYTQLSALGSMIVDVDTNRLDARFLDANGAVRDSFEIRKGGTTSVDPGTTSALRLAVPRPNPSRGAVAFEFDLPEPGSATLDVLDAAGRRVARLVHDSQPAGRRVVEWRGTEAHGLPAPAGLYWAVLSAAGETRVRRVVLTP